MLLIRPAINCDMQRFVVGGRINVESIKFKYSSDVVTKHQHCVVEFFRVAVLVFTKSRYERLTNFNIDVICVCTHVDGISNGPM